MQVINKRIIVIFICLSIFILCLFKLFNKKEIELDSVILDTQKQDNTFAIYLEESEAHYEEKDLIPTDGYIFNKEKSQCMSIDGNIINNILSYDYDNKKLIVDTTESINCYLYFDKGAGLEIIGKGPNGLNLETTNSSADWTGMYRFQGQQSEEIENYICFGTTENCNASDETRDKYMYRIIGIEESGRIKVIKKEALEDGDQWWSDYNTNKYWHESLAFQHINNETFLKNTELVPPEWIDKIDDNNWLFGSMFISNSIYAAGQTGIEVYKIESGQKEAQWDEKANGPEDEYKGVKAQPRNTIAGDHPGTIYYYINHIEKWSETDLPHEKDAKIGLVDLSDYYLSIRDDANCSYASVSNTCDKCLTGWMNLSQNDSNFPSAPELTMTRMGWNRDGGFFDVISVSSDMGCITNGKMSGLLSIRPVFFLKNNLELIDGNGTIDEPFIIK